MLMWASLYFSQTLFMASSRRLANWNFINWIVKKLIIMINDTYPYLRMFSFNY